MRKIVYLGCVFLLLVACERPLNILNSDEMSLVLADIHLAEATMGSKIPYTDYNSTILGKFNGTWYNDVRTACRNRCGAVGVM